MISIIIPSWKEELFSPQNAKKHERIPKLGAEVFVLPLLPLSSTRTILGWAEAAAWIIQLVSVFQV